LVTPSRTVSLTELSPRDHGGVTIATADRLVLGQLRVACPFAAALKVQLCAPLLAALEGRGLKRVAGRDRNVAAVDLDFGVRVRRGVSR
jgi:hypothetical protein